MENDLTVLHAGYIKRARIRFISCLAVISRLYLCSDAHGKFRLRDAIVMFLEIHKYPASHYRAILPRTVPFKEFIVQSAHLQAFASDLVPMIPPGSSSLIVRRAIPMTSIRRFSNSVNPRGHSHSPTAPDKLNLLLARASKMIGRRPIGRFHF